MGTLKEIYGDLDLFSKGGRSIVRSAQDRSIFESTASLENFSMEDSNNVAIANFGIQEKIRTLFGKKGQGKIRIGGHPDFEHLANTADQQKGFTVSLFIDIKGSTRLGLIYSPEEVFFIKNNIIRCAIETIQAFDGHVHRIMGDAVLAFFRADGESARDSAIDAINCGTYLVEFMKELVLPNLQLHNLNENVGIRVGIDYGKDQDVLWGMYGYRGASEVTATSFFVDVAAKLQQSAPRNRVMIGQSIKELLDLHMGVIEHRFDKKGEERIVQKYISPNYTDENKKSINYEQYVISHKSYLKLLPKPQDSNNAIIVSSSIKANSSTPSTQSYNSCAKSIDKPYGIEFKANFRIDGMHDNLYVKFRVENHGQAASIYQNFGNHETDVKANRRDDGSYFAKQWENTSYMGLHYMYVSVWSNQGRIHAEQCYGVYVGAPK